MAWKEQSWIKQTENNPICYTRTSIPASWTDKENTGQFRYEYTIKTTNNKDILSLDCRVVDEETRTDVKHEFYLETNQPATYRRNGQITTEWPTKHNLNIIPSEFILGKIAQTFDSLTQQVPSLEQSLQHFATLIDQRYNINRKEQ